MFELTERRQQKLQTEIARLAQPARRWVSFDFFSDAEIASLAELAEAQTFRQAQSEITHRENRVFQDFDVCFPAPRIGAFDPVSYTHLTLPTKA